MNAAKRYFTSIFKAIVALLKGMKLTGSYLLRPSKILTQQYPENRDTLYIPERFKGRVFMPHDENNEHNCTACTLCQLACPNGSIRIIAKNIEMPDGTKKKVLDQWVYNLGSCTLCQLCVDACPSDAIVMDNAFEFSVYDKSRLIYNLNKPGSRLKEKKTNTQV
jgi:NADH-quinone oxidoreductase subunit I